MLVDWPISPWAHGEKNRHIGHLMEENFLNAAQGIGKIFTGALGWSVEEHAQWVRELEEDTLAHRWHTYIRV